MIWNLKLIGVAIITIPILLAGSAWYGFSKGKQSGMLSIQTQWDVERMVIQAAQAEEQMKARQTEQALQKLIASQRKAHQNEVNRIVREYIALTDSLRDRPEARSESPSGMPEGSVAGTDDRVGCTGAQLSRPDATILVGEAARADQLRLALKACIAHSTEIERELNKE